MRKAEEGAYVTQNSVYYVINKASGGQALFKNNSLLYEDKNNIFDNEHGDIEVVVTDDNKLKINGYDIYSSKIETYFSIEPKSKFVSGLEVIGNKIASKITHSEQIKQDILDLRENKEVDFSIIKPEKELKENSGVNVYNKQSYGIAGCYVKIAKDFGYEDSLLNNDVFKTIIRNMAINTNGIAKEVVNEYEESLKNNKKSTL